MPARWLPKDDYERTSLKRRRNGLPSSLPGHVPTRWRSGLHGASAATRAPSCQTESRPDRGRGSTTRVPHGRPPPRRGRVWHGETGTQARPASLGREPSYCTNGLGAEN